MKFRITHHSGQAVPPDALDQLFEQLRARGDVVSFSKAGNTVTATWRAGGGGMSRTEEELAAIGRLEVLDAVLAACERAPELKEDWFAVSILP